MYTIGHSVYGISEKDFTDCLCDWIKSMTTEEVMDEFSFLTKKQAKLKDNDDVMEFVNQFDIMEGFGLWTTYSGAWPNPYILGVLVSSFDCIYMPEIPVPAWKFVKELTDVTEEHKTEYKEKYSQLPEKLRSIIETKGIVPELFLVFGTS